MDKGTILYHKNFEFGDGNSEFKLIIILNTPKNDEPYLFCKTTSQPKTGINSPGCYSEKNVYLLDAKVDFFSKKTWIEFYRLYEYDYAGITSENWKRNVEKKGCLRKETFNALITCIKECIDISQYQNRLLVKI